MKYKISGKNIEVTDALREKIIKKIGKLEKFFYPETEVNVTMSVEKNRHILEATIYFNGIVIRAEVVNDDMYTAIDRSIDIVEGQIRRNKTRLERKLREGAFKLENFSSNHDVEEEQGYKIVRSKKFAIKPMTVEEAVLQMNLLGHEFFMFSNADSKEVNVVYRRKDGNYGLIEPKF